MRVKMMFVVLAVATAISCGNRGGGPGTVIVVEPSENPADEMNSYLPLTPGRVTTFSDGPVSEGSSATIENLTASVDEGGVIKLRGRKVDGDSYADIEETLTFSEQDNALWLTGYDVTAQYSDGKAVNNTRIYSPPVIILGDRHAMVSGDVFQAEHVNVEHAGDPDEFVSVSDTSEDVETMAVSDLSDISASVNVEGSAILTMRGIEHDVHYLSLQPNAADRGLWYPFGYLSNGRFGLAKGIGIVSIAGHDIVETKFVADGGN